MEGEVEEEAVRQRERGGGMEGGRQREEGEWWSERASVHASHLVVPGCLTQQPLHTNSNSEPAAVTGAVTGLLSASGLGGSWKGYTIPENCHWF